MDDKMNCKTTPAGRTVAQKYADILNCSRPEPSYKHPRMSLQNRAKIFSPFAALRGYDEEIRAEQLDQLMVKKTELSEENKEKLSQKLQQIRKGMKIAVCYFEAISTASATDNSTAASHDEHTADNLTTGIYQTITATVGNVDMVNCFLRLYTGQVNDFGKELPLIIAFDDILELTLITNRPN